MLLVAVPAWSASTRLSLNGAQETLVQEFTAPPVWRKGALDVYAPRKPLSDPNFSWAAGYIWNHGLVGSKEVWPARGKRFPGWTSNRNANSDPNGDMIEQLGARSPLTWAETLNFTATPMPKDLVAGIDPRDPTGYMSASITSFPYSQRYGVFAMVAKLPGGNGIWPAFWLMPVDRSWPPEIDIMEVLGREGKTLYTTIHVNGKKGKEARGHGTETGLDLSANFHEYAVDWGPKEIKWYFDRKLVFTQPTPDEFHKPFYVIANVAVGLPDNWGGAPDESTRFPATMKVKSIRAWQRPAYAKAPKHKAKTKK
ncbi:MAG: glycoside hydrolase family 16 protein [Pseudomonadota bacterium]